MFYPHFKILVGQLLVMETTFDIFYSIIAFKVMIALHSDSFTCEDQHVRRAYTLETYLKDQASRPPHAVCDGVNIFHEYNSLKATHLARFTLSIKALFSAS